MARCPNCNNTTVRKTSHVNRSSRKFTCRSRRGESNASATDYFDVSVFDNPVLWNSTDTSGCSSDSGTSYDSGSGYGSNDSSGSCSTDGGGGSW